MKQFISKRNKVVLSDCRVEKYLKTPQAAGLEGEFLRALYNKDVAVPKVLRLEGNVIELEFIEGDTLPDYLAGHTWSELCTKLKPLAEQIVAWLESFYRAVDNTNTKEIRGDINGRNFIVSSGQIYGVDFESHVYGEKEEDIGKLIAFIENYNLPGLLNMQKQFACLISHYAVAKLGVDSDRVVIECQKETHAMSKRRGILQSQ